MYSGNSFRHFKEIPSLLFKKADAHHHEVVGERQIRGLIIDRDNPLVVTFRACPLISCNAYIFSFTTYEGLEKAIIYHATTVGPVRIGWIKEQIAHETDLSTVSIIIATPGSDLLPVCVAEDMNSISNEHWEKLDQLGFTNKIQVLFNCSHYAINSQGKHGQSICKSNLIFNKLPQPALSADSEQDRQGVSACLLL